MAFSKLSATFVLLSLLSCLTINACGTCGTPKTASPAVSYKYCPRDTLKLGVCSDILGIGNVVGSYVSSNCCGFLTGLTDVEAAACLCTAIKSNVLGINLNVPVSFSLLISSCRKTVPLGYQCK